MGLSLTSGQASIISREAAEFLRKIPSIPFANFLVPYLSGPSRIPGFRAQFQKDEDIIEEDIIARHSLRLSSTTIAGVHVLIIKPLHDKHESKIMFNIHGGGFVMGTARGRSALHMAAEFGVTVYSIDYSLAPEAKYPVARDQCLDVYRQLTKDFDTPTSVFGMSSSAGGQLMLSMLLLAPKEKLQMPAGLVFYTPASDLSGAGDSTVFNSPRDILPASFSLELVKQNYQGSVDGKDPLFSPIYGDFTEALPPTIITTGTRDLMLSNATRLYWKLRGAGGRAELFVGEGMPHGFNWEVDLPEAIQVLKAVVEFIEKLI